MRKRVIYAIVGATLWLAIAAQGAFIPGLPAVWAGSGLGVLAARGVALMSVLTLLLYALDKLLAISGSKRRFPERLLLLTGFAGMAAGAFLAQALFNHKLAKSQFQVRFMVLNLVLVVLAVLLWFLN